MGLARVPDHGKQHRDPPKLRVPLVKQGASAVDLLHYEHLKFDLAEIVRAIDARLPSDSPLREKEVRDLFARLAEDRFNLVVVGRFSRGKSTLMNAILGMDRLPTGVVPLTSVITTVTYGSDEKAVLHYHNSWLPLDIPLDQLSAYVTERGNPGNRRGISTAEVQLPAEILRKGFHFVDTPGLGSSIIENTRTTEAFLSEADAFILVTSYDSPLSEEELRTLQAIQDSDRPCFIILNKQDSVDEKDRIEVLAHVQSQLSGLLGDAVPALYSVSAQQGLAARLESNAAALAQSGVPAFEKALIDFLVAEKQRVFLLSMCARIDDLLRTIRADSALGQRLDKIREQLAREEIGYGGHTSMQPHIGTAALPDCEVCHHVWGDLFDFLAKFQNQIGTNADLRDRHVASGGLCDRHMAQFVTMTANREKCTGFAPILERQAERLRLAAHMGGSPSLLCDAVVNALPTEAACLACGAVRDAVVDVVQDIAERLQSKNGESVKSVICLPHLARLVGILPPHIGTRILDEQATVLDRLADDMKRFALKQDGVRRYLASREELTAARRGLRALLGDPRAGLNTCIPDRQ